MSLIWFALGLAVGAVFGAKHQAITLFFYTKAKPTLQRWKTALAKKFGTWFKTK